MLLAPRDQNISSASDTGGARALVHLTAKGERVSMMSFYLMRPCAGGPKATTGEAYPFYLARVRSLEIDELSKVPMCRVQWWDLMDDDQLSATYLTQKRAVGDMKVGA